MDDGDGHPPSALATYQREQHNLQWIPAAGYAFLHLIGRFYDRN